MLALVFTLLINPQIEARPMLKDLYIYAIEDDVPPEKPPKEDDLPPEAVIVV